MTSLERRWLCAIFDTILPASAAGFTPAPSDVPLEVFFRDLERSAPSDFNLGLRVAVWVVMLAPPFTVRRMRPFTSLDSAERLAVVERLAASKVYLLREIPLLLKMVGCLGYCGVPEVQSGLGIPLSTREPPAWLAVGSSTGASTSREEIRPKTDIERA